MVFKDEGPDLNRVLYRALLRLALEIMLLFIIVAMAIYLLIYLRSHCWLGWFGTGPIKVLDRYYQIENGPTYHVEPGEERQVPNVNILLGVKLSLKEECYCSDICGEIHNYKKDSSRRWLEAPQGGGELSPENGNVTVLEGQWVRPPPDERYRLEIRLRCSSQPDEYIYILRYATFILRQ